LESTLGLGASLAEVSAAAMATPPTSSPALYVDEQRQIVECGRLRAGRACRSMNDIDDAQVAAMMQQALGMSLPWRHFWPSRAAPS